MRIHKNHHNGQIISRKLAFMCCLLISATSSLGQSSTVPPLPSIPPSADPSNPSFYLGKNGWWFLTSEIKHLQTASDSSAQPDKSALSAIGDFHHYLKSLGIHLLVAPIPEKSLVRMDQILSPNNLEARKNYSIATGRYINAMTTAGIDVLDLSQQLIAETASESTHADPVYCKTDSHFTSRSASLIASWIGQHVKKSMPQLIQKNEASPIIGPKKEITIQGDLNQNTSETLHVAEVTPGSAQTSNTPAQKPSFVLMGDSHCLVFSSGGDMLAKSAGLPDYLGVEFGSMPALVAQRGGAKNSRIEFIRKSRKNKDFLSHVKLVIWCFSARELTQGDKWSILQYPR